MRTDLIHSRFFPSWHLSHFMPLCSENTAQIAHLISNRVFPDCIYLSFANHLGHFDFLELHAGFQVDRGQRHRDHRHIETLKGLIHNPFIPPILLSVGVRCSANLRRSVQCSLRIRGISHRCAAPSRRSQNRYDRDHQQQLDQREAASSHT